DSKAILFFGMNFCPVNLYMKDCGAFGRKKTGEHVYKYREEWFIARERLYEPCAVPCQGNERSNKSQPTSGSGHCKERLYSRNRRPFTSRFSSCRSACNQSSGTLDRKSTRLNSSHVSI